jgi:hypothetical protein
MLGHYLAGLIEGDGSIIVPLKNEKGKLLHPKVKITFVDKDSPLAKKLKEILGAGTIEYPRGANYINFLVQDVHTLQKIAVLQSFPPLRYQRVTLTGWGQIKKKVSSLEVI